MTSVLLRTITVGLLLTMAACAGVQNKPATAPSTDVNPITGSRGGSGSAN